MTKELIIGYVIGWTAFPLIMLPFSRVAGREQRWLDLMVAFNWSQVPQAVLVIIAIGLTSGGLASRPSAGAVQITAYLVTLLYEGYVAAVALDVAAGMAAVVVVIDVALHEFIGAMARQLY